MIKLHTARRVLCAALLTLIVVTARAEDPAEKPSVFDLPKMQATIQFTQRAIAVLFAKKDYEQAETVLRKAIETLPHVANLHYNLACALALQGKKDDALVALKEAVERGFRDPDHLRQDEDFATLRETQGYKEALVAAAVPFTKDEGNPWNYKVQPVQAVDGIAMVTESNVAWNAKLGLFRVFFQFDEEPPADAPIAKGLGKIGDLLRTWYEDGTAAGNHRDLYDNHDSDHSNMDYKALPQLTRIEFCGAAKKRKLHHGTQLMMLYNGVTIGNSSTALTAGPTWRSQGRHALMQARGGQMLYAQYRGSHLYFFPEHRDHDADHGDLYPANTPYMIISQGSSGSDKVFMNAVAATLAAFRPEVKKELMAKGMLMPTVQMIFRMSNKVVKSPDDYLTGVAHPSVFEGKQIDDEKMITMAHDLRQDVLPPLATIQVVSEDEGVPGRDYFDAVPREKLFDTPCAIARVVRSTKYMRKMIVSAETSKDMRDKPLTYHWTVLRGDAKGITIRKLNDSGSVVELLVPYHGRRSIPGRPGIESSRVDIGAFVHNGTYYSPPAFVSLFYLDNEKRVYDRKNRIDVIDYADPEVRKHYVDPLLDARKDWRDEYRYGWGGKLLGWTRTLDDERHLFTAEGRLIVEGDIDDPVKTVPMQYRYEMTSEKGVRRLVQRVAEEP